MDENSLSINKNTSAISLPGIDAKISQAADRAAAQHRFQDYRSRRAPQTLRRQKADLLLFSVFLKTVAIDAGDLYEDVQAWQGLTWGLVEGFVKWQLQKGYAVQSINIRLSTVKTYAKLAMQSGVLNTRDYAVIRTVSGYTLNEQRMVDAKRPKTRVGRKKPNPTAILSEQARGLKKQPDTPQGRRDRLLMCILLDHGFRVGEVAILTVESFNLTRKTITFFRPKVNKVQIHTLSVDTLNAVLAYQAFGDMPESGFILRKSRKDETLEEPGMSTRAITKRVEVLGAEIGLPGLSAHDCRHYWATTAARHGTDPFVLQEAGGWSSLVMPRRYVEENKIANQDIKLD